MLSETDEAEVRRSCLVVASGDAPPVLELLCGRAAGRRIWLASKRDEQPGVAAMNQARAHAGQGYGRQIMDRVDTLAKSSRVTAIDIAASYLSASFFERFGA